MPVPEVRKLIDAIDNNKTMFDHNLPFVSKELKKLVVIDGELEQLTNNELKKEFERQIDELKIHIQNLLKDNPKVDKTNVNNEID